MLELNLDPEIMRIENYIREIENEYRGSFEGLAVPFDSLNDISKFKIKRNQNKNHLKRLDSEIRLILKKELKNFMKK
ncbi:MAG: hypothetical protein BAJALOKI2v1_10053 [Promethearchaeota archaeon]|nr:MAG: hypothetical protein BAJALOKI2v1_10053 [Candidatus Lokiarchaeota archaeon]